MSFRFVLLIVLGFLVATPASAQLLTVTGEFRVVEVDVSNMRLGVARLEADPHVRQNWVTMRANTKTTVRVESADGTFRDKQEKVEEAMANLQPGDLIRVHGGRGKPGF